MEEGLFKILVVDSSAWRTNTIRISSEKKQPYRLRIAPTLTNLVEALREPWDVALVSGFLDNTQNPLNVCFHLKGAFKAGKLKGVIINTTLRKEAEMMSEYFKKEEIPVTYIPYNWEFPSIKEAVLL